MNNARIDFPVADVKGFGHGEMVEIILKGKIDAIETNNISDQILAPGEKPVKKGATKVTIKLADYTPSISTSKAEPKTPKQAFEKAYAGNA